MRGAENADSSAVYSSHGRLLPSSTQSAFPEYQVALAGNISPSRATTSNWSHGLQGTRVENKITRDESDSLAEAIGVLENALEALNIKRSLGNDSLEDLEQLSLEFSELTRKFEALKETEKLVKKNHHQRRRKNKLLNKFSQTEDNPIVEVSEAKTTITHCILQLLSISHLLDGNESEAAVIQKLLTDQCFDDAEDNFIIQSLSVGPVYFEVKSQGIYDEQEMQTDPASKTLRDGRKHPGDKKCRWFCCFGGSRKKKKRKRNKK